MKKKGLIITLVTVLIIGAFGGYWHLKNREKPVDPIDEGEKSIKKIAVFERAEDDSGLIAFLDEDDNTLQTLKIPYPIMTLYNDHSVYYSYDGEKYEGYNFITKKASKVIENVEEYPLSMSDDGGYVAYSDGVVYFHCPDGSESSSKIYLSDGGVTHKDLYCLIDSSNNLCVYDIKNNYNLLYKERLSSAEYLFLVVVNDEIYVVDDYGFTRVQKEGISMTYTYQVGFTSIYNVVLDHIFLEVDGDVVAYKIDFDKYHLILTEDKDESLYQDVDFDQLFADYYQQGYELYDFYVY